MKQIISVLLIIALGCFPSIIVAQDQSAILTWTPPTKLINGEDLTDLAGYTLHQGTESGNYTSTIDIDDPTATSYVVQDLDRETTYYFVIVTLRENGLRSAYSNEASITTGGTAGSIPPNSPNGLSIGQDRTAYTIVKSRDRISLLPVGTVQEGTECDQTQSVNGKFVIPLSQVEWAGSVRPEVVVAECFAN